MKQILAPFVWSEHAQALERTQVLSSKCGLPVKDFAGDQSLKLLLVHLLLAMDRVPADALLHRNLHLTEGMNLPAIYTF